jgi:hypothetical protein
MLPIRLIPHARRYAIAFIALADGALLVWQVYEVCIPGILLTLMGFSTTEYFVIRFPKSELVRFMFVAAIAWSIVLLISRLYLPLILAVPLATVGRPIFIMVGPNAFPHAFAGIYQSKMRVLLNCVLLSMFFGILVLTPVFGKIPSTAIGILLGLSWFTIVIALRHY